MKRLRNSALLFAAFIALFAVSVRFQSIQSERMRREHVSVQQWLYLPDSRYVQFTSIGYNHFVSDFLWLRAIQTFGQWYAHKEDIPMLMPYFDVITDLDPKFLAVYSFGNMVIGEEAGDHKQGLAILDKGIANNPNSYRPAYEGAYFAYWTMNNPDLAKYYVARALKAPDCPDFVRGWTGYFDMKQGRYRAGYENLFRDYIKFYNEGNEDLRTVRLNGLRRALREWMKTEIRAKAIEHRSPGGKYPSIAELESMRAFADSEFPDWGAINNALQAREAVGEPLPEDYNAQTKFISGFIRKGWTKLPANPASDNPNFMGWIIWPGQAPLVPKRGGDALEFEDNILFCLSELEVAKVVVDYIGMLATLAADQKKATGSCPTEEEVEKRYLIEMRKTQPEPWGGDWKYLPEECALVATSHPDLQKLYYISSQK